MSDVFNVTLTVLSIGSTVFSIIGAVNSNKYYKKSKSLTIYANTNAAVMEIENIISIFPEILKLVSKTNQRGRNYAKELTEYGAKIKSSLNEIKANLPVEHCEKMQEILNSRELNVEKYIDSFISGDILVDGELIIDDKFNKCQNKIFEIQLYLKRELEEISEKLK